LFASDGNVTAGGVSAVFVVGGTVATFGVVGGVAGSVTGAGAGVGAGVGGLT
jgi:hypothetical protein